MSTSDQQDPARGAPPMSPREGHQAPAPQASGPLVIGVLGGIASGKSEAARALAGPEGRVLSADAAAHQVLADPEVVALISGRHGPGVIAPDGSVDRAALAERVFRDPSARKELEGWIHPRVREMLWAAFEAAVQDGVPRLVIDVPLLLEHADAHGLLEPCDTLVFVDAPIEERDRRAIQNRGWETGEVERRERTQMPLDDKRSAADHIIRNDSGKAELVAQAELLLAELTSGS